MSGFGWVPDPAGADEILRDDAADVWAWPVSADAELGVGLTRYGTDKQPIILLHALLELEPHWARGAQAIGDCVSWGYELAGTLLHACMIKAGEPVRWQGVYATEPLYGLMRVEALGRDRAGYRDGASGAAAAKACTKYGFLLRQDYSKTTGNPEHDLRQYSGKKAKEWGNFGCGGKNDKDKLDELAKERPVQKAFKVTSFDQYAAAIESGYPVAICSGQGLGKRNQEGIAPPRGSWSHCMLGTGLRFDVPCALITNSWGNSWGTYAPLPGTESDAIKKCSSWVERWVVEKMLKAGDSYALTGLDGLVKREIDWQSGWQIDGR